MQVVFTTVNEAVGLTFEVVKEDTQYFVYSNGSKLDMPFPSLQDAKDYTANISLLKG